jgi:IS605 OrfB family transposase
MKLVVNIKLLPTSEQHTILKTTLEVANDACNYLSSEAFKSKIFGQYSLHKLYYLKIKERFNLSAQMAVRSIAKVADTYKKDHKTIRKFRTYSGQPYDDRILRFTENQVSIWTVNGRIKIPYQMGEYQRKLFPFRKGESDLLYINNIFYLTCVCDIDDPELIKTSKVLGVDFGIVNIAVDSNGKEYSGKAINRNRCKYSHRRKNLQKKHTRSATHKLKKLSGKQARYQKDVNHCISKAIVSDAKRTSSIIALENLKGITKKVTANKQQRSRLSNWGFYQLRTFIEYKAKQAGIPVILVNPRYTSQECPMCRHISKSNRKTRDSFICVKCGFAGPADTIAALNISARAVVNQPMVANTCLATNL